MRYLFIFVLTLGSVCSLQAQEQTAKLLQETAKTLVQKGDFDNAILVLERAKQQEPGNIDILRDLCFASYLKRDFSKAIETGKELIEKPNADQQSFQLLGLAYKAIAEYKECGKMYRTGLRKFPNSGVILNEYAELFALENDLEEAINLWEKGVEAEPGYSSNYYNAAIYYLRKGNWIRAVLYGEIFVNLESYSARTTEIKTGLYDAYKNLFTPASILLLQNAKTTSAFEKEILGILAKAGAGSKEPISIDRLISIRTRFLLEWLQGKQKVYPFHLFDRQQYLLNQGLFEAYHYWLFGASAGADANQAWQKMHAKEAGAYATFQQSRVFKIPVGEYYFAH